MLTEQLLKSQKVVRLYKNNNAKFTTFCQFHIILISIITEKSTEKYTTTLKHRITKFLQWEKAYSSYSSLHWVQNHNLLRPHREFDHITARWNLPTPISDFFQELNDEK